MEYTVDSLVSLISRIHSNAAEFTNRRLSDKKIVSSHGFILYLLSVNGSMTMGEIAQSINRDRSTTTVLVRRLKEDGFVKEEVSKKDGRAKNISLTAKGKKMNSLTATISSELLSVCYKNFSQNEKEQLLSLLLKFNENIEGELKP